MNLEHFRELLLEQRKQVLAELSDLEETYIGKNQRDSVGDVSGYSTHPADMGSDEAMRDAAFVRGESNGRVLEEIDDALMRIKDGTYGICESCGQAIGEARLEAVPFARLCVRCKEADERNGGYGRR
jgi:DnaK suppressor protein